MRKLLLFGFFLSILTCQDVIDIDAPAEEPRLIFDAFLRVNIDDPQENRIHVSTTGSFFDDVQPSLLDRIQLLNITDGSVGFYAPDPNVLGDYVPGADGVPFDGSSLLIGEPDPEHVYVLTFEYLDELYLAFASYTSAPEFISVTQGEDTLFDEDDKEIIISFEDPEEETNYYVFSFDDGEYTAFDDTFFDGQEYTFSYFTEQNLEANDELLVRMWGVDEQLYNYMRELINQSELGENPFFQTPVSTVRGNILKAEGIDNIDLFDNVGRPQEFVLGYFAYIQERSYTLNIQ